ncbi:probable peptidyl-tRNA hydrolase isoform X1 [Prionailurus iriomotensis]
MSVARSSNRGSSSCSAAEKEPSTWACTVSGWAGRPMPIRSLGIACGGARGGPREFRCPVREAPMLAHHTQGRAKGQTHMGVETANAGTDSVVLQSHFPQGLVQLIMHQVDLLSSQPKQLRLAQGNGGPGYCPSAQRALSRLTALVRRGRN